VTTSGQSAGHPARPDAPKLTATELHGGEEQAVEIDWSGVSPNGPGPTTYTVRRTPGATSMGTVVCDAIQATVCTAPAVPTDGTTYRYSVTASNAYYDSPASEATPLIAAAKPGAFTNLSATATGVSKQIRLQFTSPPAHDAGVTITCKVEGIACGSWDAPADPTAFDELILAPENGIEAAITLTATNSTASSTASVTSDTVYGPLGDVHITGLTDQGPYVAFSVDVDPAGLPATLQLVVTAGGTPVYSSTDAIGSSPYAHAYAVKAGFSTHVIVQALVRRGPDSTSDRSSTNTNAGDVTVECTTDASCSDGAVTISVINLAYSRQITCSITEFGSMWGGITFTTDSSGNAAYPVPTTTFTATSGTAYTVKCDDAGSPPAPVTTTWTAP